MIPLLHDFDGQTVLVFGGGSVGARKARRFAREARVVVVSPTFVGYETEEDTDDEQDNHDEEHTDEEHDDEEHTDEEHDDEELTGDDEHDDEEHTEDQQDTEEDGQFGGAERIRASPDPEDVSEWFDRTTPALAVAATDSGAVNEQVETVARDRGVLVNRTDKHGERDPGSVVVPATVRDDPVVAAVATGGASPALSRYLRQQIETEIADAGAMAELTGELREQLQADGVDPERRRAAIRAVVRSEEVWKALDSGVTNARQVAADVISDVTGETS